MGKFCTYCASVSPDLVTAQPMAKGDGNVNADAGELVAHDVSVLIGSRLFCRVPCTRLDKNPVIASIFSRFTFTRSGKEVTTHCNKCGQADVWARSSAIVGVASCRLHPVSRFLVGDC